MIISPERKGVVVPPVQIDVNKDGVNDILVMTLNGDVILLNGETLERLWNISLNGRESYRYGLKLQQFYGE